MTELANALSGMPLRYLIGGNKDNLRGEDGECFVGEYNANRFLRGTNIAYCNLLDQEGRGQFGPYLASTDTARDYNERVVDPDGIGWVALLTKQYSLRTAQGFTLAELDNPDAYKFRAVTEAISRAALFGLGIIAKNPCETDDPVAFLKHPNVFGAIVERNCGSVEDMVKAREKSGKLDLPIWFVGWGSGKLWAHDIAREARKHPFIGVTYSAGEEYVRVEDILKPVVPH